MIQPLFSRLPAVWRAAPGAVRAAPPSPSPSPRLRLPPPRRHEPPAGTRPAAQALRLWLTQALATPQGLPAERLLCALAALSGHACQAGARAEFVERRGLAERQVFVVLEAAGGARYCSGELIDRALYDEPGSVWRLAAGRARLLGARTTLDVHELSRHVRRTQGTPAFGLPRWPGAPEAAGNPVQHLRAHWPEFRRLVERCGVAPQAWHVAGALAIQETMSLGIAAIAPEAALRLVMEVAVPMSRLHPVAAGTGGVDRADAACGTLRDRKGDAPPWTPALSAAATCASTASASAP